MNRLCLLVGIGSWVLSVGCGGGDDPELEPIASQTVAVSETLRISLSVRNGGGDRFLFDFVGPDLPGLDSTAVVTDAGEFRWTPLAAHVGTHSFTFILRDDGGDELDRKSTVIEVIPGADTAPIFLRPGAGNTYDLERTPCVTFDVEVRDDDSASVDIHERAPLMDGATLVQEDPKRARFDWCPTPDQIAASERWTVQMEADDGTPTHQPTPHDYVIVLRTGTRTDCPGSPPTVTILAPADGGRVAGSGYQVRLSVDDDLGLREDALVYYTVSAPEDLADPDITLFDQVTASPEGGEYLAFIPDLGLGDGEEQEVFLIASATDNDDPGGALCDHRTDTSMITFTAVGGGGGGTAECAACSASEDCGTGLCADIAAGEGRCVPSCSGDGECPMGGSCGATTTIEGRVVAGCGPVEEACSGGGPGPVGCTDDPREEDDSIAAASPAPMSLSDGQICPADPDYFEIAGTTGTEITVTVDGFVHDDGDLDLQLQGPTGRILVSSASTMDREQVRYCMPSAEAVFARVYGFRDAQNGYSMTMTRTPGACCADDAGEPDDTRATARTVPIGPTGFDGTICPTDEDYVKFSVASPSTVHVEIVLDPSAGDLDAELISPSGTVLDRSNSTLDTETLDAEVPGGGTYTVRVYGYRDAGGDYLGEVTVTASGAGCTSTMSCPVDTVCDGSCTSDACASDADCPADHRCPVAGPGGAARHCAARCLVNAECRTVEACKRFPEGTGCARRGSGANGARCASFADCGGQRACLTWTNGYCARAGCTRNADCEAGTFCVPVGGINVCALDCWASDSACRLSEGYGCDFLDDVAGAGQFVCVP